MRYTKKYKDEAQRRLLVGSARCAKQHGFAASGVDALASAAGVTSGSLYKHFGGKSDLFAAMLRADLRRTAQRFVKVETGDLQAVRKALTAYLGGEHIRHPETGCPLPVLSAEVARADDAVRGAFDAGLREVHVELDRVVGSSEKAWALIAQTVGAVMLARATLDPRQRRALLDAARSSATTILGPAAADR